MIRAAGLSLSLELRGDRPAWLSAFERPGRGALSARIEHRPGPAIPMHALRLTRDGARLLVSGDGLAGSINPTDAELVSHGGDAGLRMVLRLLCAVWGAPRGILLFHGACALREGRARALLGPSGAGKTTLSRLLEAHDPRARIVSDEVTALEAGRCVAHGHPFQSQLGDGQAPDAGAPLSSIDLLQHGGATEVAPLGKSEAARLLLPRIFLPLREPESLRAALGAVERLVEQVPVRRFAFAPDASAVAA